MEIEKGLKVRQMNPKLGHLRTSPDAEQKNPAGQRPGANRSVRKLQLRINKGGDY